MSVDEKEPKDHPLWPEFIEWCEDDYQVQDPQWDRLIHWSRYWECFLAGARAESKRMLEAT